MTDNIISFEEKKKLKDKIKDGLTVDSVYVVVVIPTDATNSGVAFVEFDERADPYMAIGMLEFGKKLILDGPEKEDM